MKNKSKNLITKKVNASRNTILVNRFLPLIEEPDEDSDLWNELCAEVMRPQNEFLTNKN